MSIVGLSYVTLDEAEAYMSTFGHKEWANELDSDAKKTTALVKATQFIDTIGNGKWKGHKTFIDQKLAFPRTGASDFDGVMFDQYEIPEQIYHATCEAAIRFYMGNVLIPDTAINVASEKVGELQVSYFENKSGQPVYSLIFGLLAGLVIGGNIAGTGTTAHNVTRGFA